MAKPQLKRVTKADLAEELYDVQVKLKALQERESQLKKKMTKKGGKFTGKRAWYEVVDSSRADIDRAWIHDYFKKHKIKKSRYMKTTEFKMVVRTEITPRKNKE